MWHFNQAVAFSPSKISRHYYPCIAENFGVREFEPTLDFDP